MEPDPEEHSADGALALMAKAVTLLAEDGYRDHQIVGASIKLASTLCARSASSNPVLLEAIKKSDAPGKGAGYERAFWALIDLAEGEE